MKMVYPNVNAMSAAWLLAIMAPLPHPAWGEEAADREPIRIAIYADSGASKEAPNLTQCLSHASEFVYELVTAKDIRDGALDRFDVVIHPGGSGRKQAEALGVDGRRAVCRFVERGGGFVGICAGVYLVSAQDPYSLALVDAREVDPEHWARGTGEVQLRLTESGRRALGVDRETLTIYYGQGPLLAPAHNDAIPDYELLATYETEIAKNGAPAGVMKGTAAIARGTYGRGRVFCFSPHPEKTDGLETLVHAAVRWAAGARYADRQPIRIAIYADSGANESGSPTLTKCFSPASDFVYELVTAKDIRDGVLDRFDVVIHPGGSGQEQAEALGADGCRTVSKFVERGGGFVGICAGAYLASDHYVWSLGLLDARLVDRKHWERGTGEVQLRLLESGRKALGVDQETLAIYYGQGPLLAPDHNDDIPDYELLATYETEIAKNGAPAGVMKGTAAIARGAYGRGRVFCFSPHPEKTPGCNSFVCAAVRWAAESRITEQ